MAKNEIFNVRNMVRLALVAALYAVMTLLIQPLAYGLVQFRFSEILVLLCFYRKDYGVALTVGCFIANLLSPYGLDIVFGTLGTAAAVFLMYYMKNIFIAAILPVITNGLLVGLELYLYGDPLWLSIGLVALGELGVMAVGVILFKSLVERQYILKIIGCTKDIGRKKSEVKQ